MSFEVSIKDNRQAGYDDVLHGNIIKIKGWENDIILYLDTGYTLSIPRDEIENFLMIDKLKEAK